MHSRCLLRAVAGGSWRTHRGRSALAVLGIAFGVALGLAVHLINASATDEFTVAVRAFSGDSDLVVRGPRSGFPEAVYATIARFDGVADASPAVEIDAKRAERGERGERLRIVGVDPFRAGAVQPNLLSSSRERLLELLEGDAVLLSHGAAQALALSANDTLTVETAAGPLSLRVLGVLDPGATPERLALMDIASAQWRFGALGIVHRVHVKLEGGTRPTEFGQALKKALPGGFVVSTPDSEVQRSTELTRAYRINLNMLALVALFTGAFLVFSTQFLALLKRRTQLALLRVVGVTRNRLLQLLLLESALLGAVGAGLGVALGTALAHFALARVGGDLGAGYFGGVQPALVLNALPLAFFFFLGVVFSVLGALLPALEASRRPPALALRAGDEEAALRRVSGTRPAFALLLTGAVLSQAPAVSGVPVFGYAAVAALLIGAVLILPRLTEVTLRRIPRPRSAASGLAAAQLAAAPRQAAIGLAAIVVSFSLVVSMLIMIGSFRMSLEDWLGTMLPADLYARIESGGGSMLLDPLLQSRISALPGVAAAAFIRSDQIELEAGTAPLSLIVRDFVNGEPQPPLPLTGGVSHAAAVSPPAVFLSEIAAQRLDVGLGQSVELPIAGQQRRLHVSGIWRDYARQNGAAVIDRAFLRAITGTDGANEFALTLAPAASFDDVAERVRTLLGSTVRLDLASTRELKQLSLAIFDRTFAVTYALQAAAILIGLFGISASFSAQALSRRREFGVLRYLGMRRREVAKMLAWEGTAVGTLGVLIGLALGWLISLVLVHVINRQSFGWSMDMHLPWLALLTTSLTLVATSALTAALSGRRAMADEAIHAVREDW